jgi:methylenetetrahydrofolate dehydrogenase (NADP+)/methenyltetrahydrofolate cyclohydrolase
MEIDGRAITATITEQVRADVERLKAVGVEPRVGILTATEDASTAYYVRSIVRAAERSGVAAQVVALPDSSDTATLEAACRRLGAASTVHGIIAQTPFPEGVDGTRVVQTIPARKDVDGATIESAGRLFRGLPAYAPATAQAVMEILAAESVELSGSRVVIVGRSLVVGKPLAVLMLGANATVTVCHSRTRDLPAVCREADVLVAAVGKAHTIGPEHVRVGAVVIDVGTNATDDGLQGDVDFDAVAGVAEKVTPVPGGVGPVTTACLLRNVVSSALEQPPRSEENRQAERRRGHHEEGRDEPI